MCVCDRPVVQMGTQWCVCVCDRPVVQMGTQCGVCETDQWYRWGHSVVCV